MNNLKNLLEKYKELDNDENSFFVKLYETKKVIISENIRKLTEVTKATLKKDKGFDDSISDTLSSDELNQLELNFQFFNDISD